MYAVLAAQWGISRSATKLRIWGKGFTTVDPADDLTEQSAEMFREVVQAAWRRRAAEERIKHHA
jgi:hypothetical protein